MKPFLIVIYGKSGTGKDTLMESVINDRSYINKVLRTTTRPQRVGESDDNYEFLSPAPKDFEPSQFVEYQFFRGWFYGTRKANISGEINIMTGSIEVVKELQDLYSDKFYIYPVFLEMDDKARMYRTLQREKNPDMHEICRRFVSEVEQYSIIDSLENVGLRLDAEKTTQELTVEFLQSFNTFILERLTTFNANI